jgi:Spy/CpxP family protein refolding chaperone
MQRFKLVGFFGALAAALTLSGVGFARQPFGSADSHHDPGAFIEENAEVLGLNDETLGAIRSIVGESKDTGDQLHAKLRELHKGMKALLAQDSPDEAAVMRQVDAIGAAEVEMQRHRLGTMLKIRALLTPEQREEMTRLREDTRGLWKHALLEACDMDLVALCPEADDRWSRKQCLKENREKVTEECSDALKAARRARHDSHKGCSEHGESGCPMHGESGCPMHGESGCPMHGESGCPMHGESGCPMHGESGCPMHGESGCPKHRASGCSEHSESGCPKHRELQDAD